jgi:hypothetical protein
MDDFLNRRIAEARHELSWPDYREAQPCMALLYGIPNVTLQRTDSTWSISWDGKEPEGTVLGKLDGFTNQFDAIIHGWWAQSLQYDQLEKRRKHEA